MSITIPVWAAIIGTAATIRIAVRGFLDRRGSIASCYLTNRGDVQPCANVYIKV